MNFNEAFEKYIKGQIVVDEFSILPFGDKNKPMNQRYYGSGLKFGNGYKILYYGGGCSGEDCNTTFIVDEKDNLVDALYW
jgi:hypothetical protein